LREAILLGGPSGEVTELHIEALELEDLQTYFVVTPRHELAPGAYELRSRLARNAKSREEWGEVRATFSVGTIRADKPLAPPSASVMNWWNEDHGQCGTAVGVSLEVAPMHWLLAYEAVDPARPDDKERLSTGYTFGSQGPVWFGHGRCTFTWDFGQSSARVRFGSLDYAGKFSGFGPPLELHAPWTPGELRRESLARIKSLHKPDADAATVPPRSGSCACRLHAQRGHDVGASAWLALMLVTTTCWRRARPCLRPERW
jgi:hypothetical protein